MWIERKALAQEIPAVAGLDTRQLCELLASLGFPVDGVTAHEGTEVLDVDITPNRGDAMSHRGLAREIAAKLQQPLMPFAAPAIQEGAPVVDVRLESPACPVYSTAVLDLGPGATPLEVQTFLLALESTPKRLPAVDASNELLHRYGHPTHAFDAERIRGAVTVRWAKTGETLVALDGVSRTLVAQDLVIADESGPIALAGVMGGDGTKVTEATRRVLLESAWFDPKTVRATARRHSLHTDASHRFGRGADPAMASVARDLLVQRLQTWCGAKLSSAWTVGAVPSTGGPVVLTNALLTRVAGEPLPLPEAAEALRRLGCAVDVIAEGLRVLPPSWRHDLAIPDDLAEEVLRLRGYEHIPSGFPPLEGPPEPLSPSYLQRQRLSRRLAHLGFHQTVTYGFISPEEDEAYAGADNPQAGRTLANPLSREYSVMRASLLPGLMEALNRSASRGAKETRLFEIAPVFRTTPERPKEDWCLAIVWEGETGGEDPFTEGKNLLERGRFYLTGILESLGLGPDQARECVQHRYSWGKDGSGTEVGVRVWCAEVRLKSFPGIPTRIIPAFTPFSRYPEVTRDLSLLVPAGQSHADLRSAMVAALPGETIRDLRCVDVYPRPDDSKAKRTPVGQQAWLMRMRFQAMDRTLVGEEVDGWVAAALAAAESLGARLRA